MKSVVVSIVSYNGKKYLGRCIEQALSQTHPPADIYLLDNASTDGSVDYVSHAYPDVKLISSPSNIGFGAGHNRIISRTNSDFVLVLNQDAFLSPTFIEELVAGMDADADVGIAGGKLYSLRETKDGGSTIKTIDMTFLDIEKKRRQVCYEHGRPDNGGPAGARRVFAIDGAVMLLRRTMLDEIELDGEFFDEDFFAGKEDLDISWRAQLCGWKCIYVPSAVGEHLRTFSPKDRRTRISEGLKISSIRNRYLLMIKNDFLAHIFRHFPQIAWYEVQIAAYVLLRERSSLQGYAEALKLIPKTLQKRRMIMRRKRVQSEYILQWFR